MTLRELRAIVNFRLGIATHLFIHIPKNAGVAVRKSPMLINRLVSAEPYFHKSRAYSRELADYMREQGEHHGFQHARLRDLDQTKLARLQPVAIIRNPWARVVSRFRFAQTAKKTGTATQTYSADRFEAFLEERHEFGNKPFYWHRAIRGWYPQIDYVTDAEMNIAVDLLRQEEIDVEIQRYFDLPGPIRKRNVSHAGAEDYRNYYTPKTIQSVADWYRRDIEAFGFDFDSSATKNMLYQIENERSCLDPTP